MNNPTYAIVIKQRQYYLEIKRNFRINKLYILAKLCMSYNSCKITLKIQLRHKINIAG